MAGTTVVAARQKVVALLAADPDLTGVEVAYSWDRERKLREAIWTDFGPQTDSVIPVMRQGTQRRQETYTFWVVIEVRRRGGTQQACDERALVLLRQVEELLATNPSLDGAVLTAVLEGFDVVAGEYDRGHYGCQIAALVECEARLL